MRDWAVCSNFSGIVEHGMYQKMLREKVKDERFIRYIIRMFKAGMLSGDELLVSDEGVPQESICSPILSNIYTHFVIDAWFDEVVKKHCRGRVELFRYADDAITYCRWQGDAERIKVALVKRLAKFGLKLNEDKTKKVPFSKVQTRKRVKQGVLDFLGFTFYLSRSRKGFVVPKVKTSGKRMRSKLTKVNIWARRVRNRARLPDIWRVFQSKHEGHIRYYRMSFNSRQLDCFRYRATRIVFKWLNRRSQRKSFNWDQFMCFMQSFPLPKVKIYHQLSDPAAVRMPSS